MAGIIAPVLIHLWNNKQGRMLSIGSLDFLDKTVLRRARSRRISDWWLLVLRCLLLIMLAVLLAGPVWKQKPGTGKKGWVLVGGPTARMSQVDSLVHEGFQRQDMKGFSWWESFHRLDQQAPSGIPFYVFTDGLLEHFQGNRPVTRRPVYWYLSQSRDSTVHWVHAAWKQGADSIGVVTGSSGATGTSYTYRTSVNSAASAGAASGDTTSVDTTTLQVAIYADEKYTRDAQWVDGAVRAVQQFTRRNIAISRWPAGSRKNDLSPATGPVDWLFWLSEKPLAIKAANTLLYEPGRVTTTDTWIKGSDIPVEKVTGQAQGLKPIWADGFGKPLLTLEETDSGRRYHFFSHFDPAWNGLVWSRDFPVRIETLLLDQAAEGPRQTAMARDRRVIDPAQVTPSTDVNAQDGLPAMATLLDLSPFGWLLAFLTLVAERILSFKRSKDG